MTPATEAQMRERQRPAAAPVMFQTWSDLLFLHWRWPAEDIASRLPPGLTVETFAGSGWMGVVPFFMRNVRPAGLPSVLGISNFLELNLRTYVQDERGRPGIWFFSLDANQPLAVLIARRFFSLNYRFRTMQAVHRANGWIRYDCRSVPRSLAQRYEYRADGPARAAEPDTLEFFLLERYRLYAAQEHRLFSGRVYHVPYEYSRAEIGPVDARVFESNEFVHPLRPPDHVAYARRVDVSIYPLERNAG